MHGYSSWYISGSCLLWLFINLGVMIDLHITWCFTFMAGLSKILKKIIKIN